MSRSRVVEQEHRIATIPAEVHADVPKGWAEACLCNPVRDGAVVNGCEEPPRHR